MVGFIQCSSDPSQPGRALDKKKIKNFIDFLDELDHLEQNTFFSPKNILKEADIKFGDYKDNKDIEKIA